MTYNTKGEFNMEMKKEFKNLKTLDQKLYIYATFKFIYILSFLYVNSNSSCICQAMWW